MYVFDMFESYNIFFYIEKKRELNEEEEGEREEERTE